MAQDNSPEADPNARYVVPDDKKRSAAKWFAQGRKLADQRNYDYAIKSFTEGLTLNPEAVEEGYMPLRVCGVARRQVGGKKPGMMENVKHSTSGKDPVKNMVNAAWLLAHEPGSSGPAEALFRNANKAHCDNAMFWVGPILHDNLAAEKKPSAKKFTMMKDCYEELGDRCQARGEMADALKAYEAGLNALDYQRRIEPKNRDLDNIIRDLSTKLTILRGNYQSADSFRESIQDSEKQRDLHDQDRAYIVGDRLNEMIENARLEMEKNPDVEAKVIAYTDLLCKNEDEERENLAMKVLAEKYKATGTYRFKHRADDIASRQLGRATRKAKAAGDTEKANELSRRRMKFEEKVFAERTKQYPTDLRMKYEYARRLFLQRKFDEAIPLFQQARSEPKVRYSCSLYLGRCFYENKYYSQAMSTLEEAIASYELEDDTTKELNYWLGRAQEADGNTQAAVETYGKLLQIDYNYRDVKKRLEALKQG